MEVGRHKSSGKKSSGKKWESLSMLGGYNKPLADLFGALSSLRDLGMLQLKSQIQAVETSGAPTTAQEGRLEVAVFLTAKGITLDETKLCDDSDFNYEGTGRQGYSFPRHG